VIEEPPSSRGSCGTNEGIELLLNRLAKTETNAAFLASRQKGAEASA
jgi:hypothetical protein